MLNVLDILQDEDWLNTIAAALPVDAVDDSAPTRAATSSYSLRKPTRAVAYTADTALRDRIDPATRTDADGDAAALPAAAVANSPRRGRGRPRAVPAASAQMPNAIVPPAEVAPRLEPAPRLTPIRPLARAMLQARGRQPLHERLANTLEAFVAPHQITVEELLELQRRFPPELADALRDFLRNLRAAQLPASSPDLARVSAVLDPPLPNSHAHAFSELFTGMPVVLGTCCGQPCNIKIDDGAGLACMSYDMFTRCRAALEAEGTGVYEPVSTLVRAADNQPLAVHHFLTKVRFQLAEHKHVYCTSCIVMPMSGTDLMLGGTFLERTQSMLDYEDKVMHVRTTRVSVRFQLSQQHRVITVLKSPPCAARLQPPTIPPPTHPPPARSQ
jgi:hypothetical protein